MRGSLGEKIGEGVFADVHAWAPGQVVKLFKAGVPAAAQLVRGAHDPRRLRRRRPGAGGARRGDPGGALRHRAAAPRRTDPAAALAERRHDARAGGRDPRDPLPCPFTRRHRRRTCSPCATGWTPALRFSGGSASGAHRHRRPRPDRAPAAGRRAVPWRPSPRQRDHDGGGSETYRLDRCGPRARRPRPCVHATSSCRDRPGTSPTIRSGRARSMRPCSPSTRGWPACPRRR